jgi:hypothetical protein|tara:strand:- start:38 stop:979 length:942 start_codon:yes stop_codon:yes gene_type:complete
MTAFSFANTSSGSAYFTYETVRNSNGIYDSASLKAASGRFLSLEGINEDHIVQSDYIWSAVIPEGESTIDFLPASLINLNAVYFRGTGNLTATIGGGFLSPTLSPVQLNGQGTLNSVRLQNTINTRVVSEDFYNYVYQPSNAVTNWNTLITTGSANNTTSTAIQFGASQDSEEAVGYGNTRSMINFNLSNVPGTITSIGFFFITSNVTTTGAFDIKMFGAGTASLGGGVEEYSLYRDEGSTAFSSTLSVNKNNFYSFELNAAALAIANTKPANFVVAIINGFDYTATAPANNTNFTVAFNTQFSNIALSIVSV